MVYEFKNTLTGSFYLFYVEKLLYWSYSKTNINLKERQLTMSDESKTESQGQKVYNTHDLDPVPKNLFKSFRHAKKIIAKVALEFFEHAENSDNLDKFESFMKGTLRPKFVMNIGDVGYFPDLAKGCYSVAVFIDKNDSDEVKFNKWNAVLAKIQPSTGDFTTRNLIRIYQDFFNDEERKNLEKEVQREIDEEDQKKNRGKINE